jgi:hypothetical protein
LNNVCQPHQTSSDWQLPFRDLAHRLVTASGFSGHFLPDHHVTTLTLSAITDNLRLVSSKAKTIPRMATVALFKPNGFILPFFARFALILN